MKEIEIIEVKIRTLERQQAWYDQPQNWLVSWKNDPSQKLDSDRYRAGKLKELKNQLEQLKNDSENGNLVFRKD
ncbi:hypothetical protein [Flectobacillus major]|uniref:hypothetical protein n=1 Tax=Flectobacillus major TaxID=103 RepID=UPI00041C5EB0|nr:hypothetical protein [Flectobacillus major]